MTRKQQVKDQAKVLARTMGCSYLAAWKQIMRAKAATERLAKRIQRDGK